MAGQHHKVATTSSRRPVSASILSVGSASCRSSISHLFISSQLFNELYYLVDGGTLWIDRQFTPCQSEAITGSPPRLSSRPSLSPAEDGIGELRSLPLAHSFCVSSSLPASMGVTTTQFHQALQSQISATPLFSSLQGECAKMDQVIRQGHGDPREVRTVHRSSLRIALPQSSQVGRFLYLEGHEYLMFVTPPPLAPSPHLTHCRYNTYDVHFYAGFALLMVYPSCISSDL
jgi:hypothetical protein